MMLKAGGSRQEQCSLWSAATVGATGLPMQGDWHTRTPMQVIARKSSPKNTKAEYILGCTVGKQNLGAELLPSRKRGKEERETKTLLLLGASSQ